MTKVAIQLDEDLLKRVDRLVEERRFPDRNQVIQIALREKIAKLDRSRLLEEAAKLDPEEEQALAEEGMAGDAAEWPRY
jgi:metal-responsive CopG/Arc/MetJ family transcriptional regulator